MPWLLLWQGAWVWQCNSNAGEDSVPGIALEVVFLLAAVFAAAGTLIWIAGSLDGARLQALRLGQRTGLHGDRVALALLVTVVMALVLLRPMRMAADLDRFAAPLQRSGYRLVPLCLELAAMGLDRADPRYPMVCAELFDTLGKHERAATLRNDLRRRWESYAEHLLREEVRIGGLLYPPLLTITGESEALPPFLADSTLSARTMGDSATATPAPKDSLASAAAPGDSATSTRAAADAKAATTTGDLPPPTSAALSDATSANVAGTPTTGSAAASPEPASTPTVPESGSPDATKPAPAPPGAGAAPTSVDPAPARSASDSTRTEDTAPRVPRPRSKKAPRANRG